jgi:hypothetical protein
MKRSVILGLWLLVVLGCGKSVARLDRLSRAQAAILTDANAYAADTRPMARPPVHVTDPDRLAALEKFLDKRQGRWKKADGTPRATRFQLELVGNDRPLYTIWLDPGYMAMANGKKVQEARLSSAETAELLACLGLPPDFLNPGPAGGYPVAPAGYPPAWGQGQPGTPMPMSMPASGVIPAGGEAAPSRPGAARL